MQEDQNNQEYRRHDARERRKIPPAHRWEDQHDTRRGRRQRRSCRVLRYRRQEGNREDFAGPARGTAEATAENRRKKTKGGCADRIRAVADAATELSPLFGASEPSLWPLFIISNELFALGYKFCVNTTFAPREEEKGTHRTDAAWSIGSLQRTY